MKVFIFDNKSKVEVEAEISIGLKPELPFKKEKWNFDWKGLVEKKAIIYKLSHKGKVQGLLKMKKVDEDFYEMANLELSPENYGSTGRFDRVAGCLIAYASLLSFELNMGSYIGFLSFKSKTELIELYEKKYLAELVYRDRMIISPRNGKQLIKQYLKIDL